MKKPIISISIILLIVFLLTYFVLLDKYNEVISLRFDVKQKEAGFKDLEDYFKDLSYTDEELKKYESEMAKVKTALPSDPSIPSLLYFIQKTAEENGLLLKEIGLGQFSAKKREESEIIENRFFINVFGSYSSFKNFLSVLEKSARLIEVERISFSSSGRELVLPEKGFFLFDLEMKVYSY